MRYRWLILPALLTAVLFLAPDDSRGQPGGGGPGGGRGPRDPNQAFDDLARQSGGTDVIDFGKLPPETKSRMNRFAQMSGAPPFPETGTMTRQQFVDQSNRNMEAMRARWQQGGGGPPMPGGGPVAIQTGPGGTMVIPGGPGGDRDRGRDGDRGGDRGRDGDRFRGGPPGMGGPGMGGPPGMGGGPNSDEDNMRRFRERDRNQDGKISMEESSSFMRPVFQQYDRNGDGQIDYEEYKPYMAQFNQNRGGGGGPPGGGGGPPGMPSQGSPYPQSGSYPYPQPGGGYPGGDNRDGRGDRDRRDEEQRPVVYRYGKLPKELPGWFGQLDTDTDGQVGLYEWRRDSRRTTEFVEMDLNADGYLTAEEWIRYSKQQIEQRAREGDSAGSRGGDRGPGGNRGPGGGERGPGGNRGPGGGERPAGGERGPGGNRGPGGGERSPGGERPGGGERRDQGGNPWRTGN